MLSRKHLGIDKVKNVLLVLVVLPELMFVDSLSEVVSLELLLVPVEVPVFVVDPTLLDSVVVDPVDVLLLLLLLDPLL
jgi:hypothetical protein